MFETDTILVVLGVVTVLGIMTGCIHGWLHLEKRNKKEKK